MRSIIGSGDTVRVEEVPDNELFKLLPVDLPISISVNDLHVGGNVGGRWLKALVHSPIAVHQPLCYFNSLAHSVAVTVVSLDYFSI